MEFIKNPDFDFLGRARACLVASLCVVAGGLYLFGTRGLSYGVEFSGGTQLVVQFSSPPAIDRVRDAVEPVAPGAVIQTYDDPSKNQVLIRIAEVGEAADDTAAAGSDDDDKKGLDAPARRALKAIGDSYPENAVLGSSTEIVGPIVGAELRTKAVNITVLGLMFQLMYIAFRFKGAVWGAAATLAVLHDVLVTLTLLTLFDYEITLNVIAALLTLVGYSVNDTIVIFDRARENLRQRRKVDLQTLLNTSVNQTLSRTLISTGTTFMAVLSLFLFGGEVLRGFAFTMVVGVLVGTYSTIFIATPFVLWWRRLKGKEPAAKATAA